MRSVRFDAHPRALAGHVAKALLVSSVLLGSPAALADEASAREHFKKGVELYDKQQYEDALVEFQRAYAEKPSPGIKQNIALSLKRLNRLAEAATAFDQALDEGEGALKPTTRGAIERELAELSKSVATVRVAVVTVGDNAGDRKPVPGVVISILPAGAEGAKVQSVSEDALRRPIRLMPGIYTFSARAPGYPDPPEKRLALVTGAPVDAMFVVGSRDGAGFSPALGPNEGLLRIGTNVPGAVIRVDGVELPQRGTFSGAVRAGVHKVEITAAGWKTTTLDVDVAAGKAIDEVVTLQAIGDAPGEYQAQPAPKPKKPKKAYVVAAAAVDTVSYRLGVPLGEPTPYGTRRSNFVGVTLGGRLGYMLAKTFALEALLELGNDRAKYARRPGDAIESQTTVSHWQLTPMARFFAGRGTVRFTAATGFGAHGLAVESKLAESGTTLTKKGSGVGFSWIVDAGIQADAGPLFLEVAGFFNVHGVGAVRDEDSPEARLLYASPATRGGVRIGLGIPF